MASRKVTNVPGKREAKINKYARAVGTTPVPWKNTVLKPVKQAPSVPWKNTVLKPVKQAPRSTAKPKIPWLKPNLKPVGPAPKCGVPPAKPHKVVPKSVPRRETVQPKANSNRGTQKQEGKTNKKGFKPSQPYFDPVYGYTFKGPKQGIKKYNRP